MSDMNGLFKCGLSLVNSASGKILSDVGKYPSGFEMISENASLGERALYGLKVTLIGMVAVFAVLIIIWICCALLGKVLGNAGNKNESKAQTEAAPKNDTASAEVPVQTSVTAFGETDYKKISVIATAAIAAYNGKDEVDFTVVSVNPLSGASVALSHETIAQISAAIAFAEGKDTVDFSITSIKII